MHIYEEYLGIYINVFLFFDDKGKARYLFYISFKNCGQTANLRFIDDRYALITNVRKMLNYLKKTRTTLSTH